MGSNRLSCNFGLRYNEWLLQFGCELVYVLCDGGVGIELESTTPLIICFETELELATLFYLDVYDEFETYCFVY